MKIKFIVCLLLILTFTLVHCKKEKKVLCNYSEIEEKGINGLLQDELFLDSIKLPSIRLNEDIIRYRRYNSWGSYAQVLTVWNKSNRYFIHYISVNKDIKTHKKSTNLKEKELSKSEIMYIKSSINNLKCLPFDLDSQLSVIDDDLFSLVIKNLSDTIGFVGVPYFYTEGNAGYYYDETKEKILSFVGTLLKMVGAEHGKKVLVKDPNKSKDDTVRYEIYLDNTYVMTKNYRFFYKQKELNKNGGDFSVHNKDTFNLYDSVKVIETLWNGEVVKF